MLRQKLKEITLRMQAGQLTLTDVDQTASRVPRRRPPDRCRGRSVGGQCTLCRRSWTAARWRMDGHGLPPGLPKGAAEAIQLAEPNSPTVIASLFRMNAAEQAIAVARAALLPSVSLSAQAGADQGQSIPTVSTKQASVTVNVSVPVYQGGALSSQVRQARRTRRNPSCRPRFRGATRERMPRSRMRPGGPRRRSAGATGKVQLPLAEAAYDNVRKEAAVGAKSTFELLGQLQELFNSRISEVQARYDVASSCVPAAGGGWPFHRRGPGAASPTL